MFVADNTIVNSVNIGGGYSGGYYTCPSASGAQPTPAARLDSIQPSPPARLDSIRIVMSHAFPHRPPSHPAA